MSVTYKLIKNPVTNKIVSTLIKKIDGETESYITIIPGGSEFQEYLEWEAQEGNHIQDPD